MKFNLGEAFSKGFALAKQNLGLLIGLGLIVFAISVSPALVRMVLQLTLGKTVIFAILSVLISLASIVINIWLSPIMNLGILGVNLKLVDGQAATYADLWAYKNKWLRYWGASILLTLMIFGLVAVAGVVFAIFVKSLPVVAIVAAVIASVAFFYVALRLQFFGFAIIDRDAGAREAIRQSWQLTSGQFPGLLAFTLVSLLINFVGILLLGLGLILTLPTTALAQANVYRQLTSTN